MIVMGDVTDKIHVINRCREAELNLERALKFTGLLLPCIFLTIYHSNWPTQFSSASLWIIERFSVIIISKVYPSPFVHVPTHNLAAVLDSGAQALQILQPTKHLHPWLSKTS